MTQDVTTTGGRGPLDRHTAVTHTLRASIRRRPGAEGHQELMRRISRIVEHAPLAPQSELSSLTQEVTQALLTAKHLAARSGGDEMETAYWCYQVARLHQCRRLLERTGRPTPAARTPNR